MDLGLGNKVAIVTGAGQWIGRAIALCLAKEGADVAVNDIILERANNVVDEIKALGRKAVAFKADVIISQEVDQMVKGVLEEFGKIDILVNNVGGPSITDEVGRAPSFVLFCDSEEEEWDKVVNRNLRSTRNCSRAVIGHMMEKRSGRIINIGSGAGIRGSAGSADYSAAKGGIMAFTMSLAKEVVSYGIRVNCVCPGIIGAANSPPERVEYNIKMSGLGREGRPEEVAAMVAFLASEQADCITGRVYSVSGLQA